MTDSRFSISRRTAGRSSDVISASPTPASSPGSADRMRNVASSYARETAPIHDFVRIVSLISVWHSPPCFILSRVYEQFDILHG